MIPCWICGRDASTGWTEGFVPAGDSHKLALCPEHDTEDNRLALEDAWRSLLLRNISTAVSIARYRAAPSLQSVSVHFTAGGTLSFTCLSCFATDHDALCIEAPDGAKTYIPLRHISDYTLRPCLPEDAD
ncbi:MAG: hypothetical protein LBU06_04810 [Desulfovibrio sp.]|nr:hypothetical protein [Desulfovibrio sp.]